MAILPTVKYHLSHGESGRNPITEAFAGPTGYLVKIAAGPPGVIPQRRRQRIAAGSEDMIARSFCPNA